MRYLYALLLLAASISAGAGPGLTASDGWIRDTAPTSPVRAGYLVLRNEQPAPRRVMSVRSVAFGAIEIHEMVDAGDGVMRMRQVSELVVPAQGEVILAPGGLHLMLFRPARPLEPGDRVDLTLELDDGSTVDTMLEQR
jgi:copper(I)-binding protein